VEFNNNPPIIAYLLAAGADATLSDNQGKRAIDYADENELLKLSDVYGLLKAVSN
jgi:hypothetical protein